MEKEMDLKLELTGVGNGLYIGPEYKQRIVVDPCTSGVASIYGGRKCRRSKWRIERW